MKNLCLVTQRQNLICICGNRCKFWKLFQYLVQFVFNQLKMRAWFLTHQWSQRVMKEPSLLFCSLHKVSVLKWLLTFSVNIWCFSVCAEHIHEWQTEFRASLFCLSLLTFLASTPEIASSTGCIAQVYPGGSWDASVLWSLLGSPLRIRKSEQIPVTGLPAALLGVLILWPSCFRVVVKAKTGTSCTILHFWSSTAQFGDRWLQQSLSAWWVGRRMWDGKREGNYEWLFFLLHGAVTAAPPESCCPSLPRCRHSIALL